MRPRVRRQLTPVAALAGSGVVAPPALSAFLAGDIPPGLYPEQLYGAALTRNSATPEAFAMQ